MNSVIDLIKLLTLIILHSTYIWTNPTEWAWFNEIHLCQRHLSFELCFPNCLQITLKKHFIVRFNRISWWIATNWFVTFDLICQPLLVRPVHTYKQALAFYSAILENSHHRESPVHWGEPKSMAYSVFFIISTWCSWRKNSNEHWHTQKYRSRWLRYRWFI